MNKEPETYEELIRKKRCVYLTRYYDLSMEELEQINESIISKLEDIYENKDSLANIRKLGKVGIKEIEEVLEYRGLTKNGIPIKIKPNDKEKSKIIEGIQEKRSQFLERISLDDSNEVGITNSNNKGKFNQEAEREDNSRED